MINPRFIHHLRENWVEYLGCTVVVFMLLFAFPALFVSYDQALADRRALEGFEK
jgi:hypothetical protein